MKKVWCLVGFVMSVNFVLAQVNVTYTVNTGTGRKSISPYVYGNNMNEPWSRARTENVTARRLGGNRLSTYNWEHNFSNAGNDYGPHATDTWLFTAMGVPVSASPAALVKAFHDTSLLVNAYSMVTIPAAGYVAKNVTKFVTTNAPSADWDQIQAVKGSAFTLTPSTADGVVYMDEFINRLLTWYGSASTATGIKGYSIDNEPDLWNSTHSRMHPAQTTCQEVVDKNTTYSNMIKQMDANADVFGFVSYGYGGLRTCQGASDWSNAAWSGTYPWYVDAYLDKMKTASTTAGKRLIDVLDFHYYSEHTGLDNSSVARRVYSQSPQTYDSHNGVRTARMQAPRSLWDPTFTETSWITSVYPGAMQLIPTLFSKISTRYPGTKLSISEYDFGAEDDISGGIATADALGVFGQQGLYMANYWGDIKNYVSLAFKLYRNYDGNKSTFENTTVTTTTSSLVNSTIYGSVNSSTNGVLHLVVTNKNLTNPVNGTFTITSTSNYTSAKIYGFQNGSSSVSLMSTIAVTGNSFTYSLPALSAVHIVLTDPAALPVKITSFNGQCDKEKHATTLLWETENEEKIKTYEVEKSTDAQHWTILGTVNAQKRAIYEYSDATTSESTTHYYRLKVTENNGEINYSSIILVENCNRENITYTLFPNPNSDGFYISAEQMYTDKLQITIKDITGKIVETTEYSLQTPTPLGTGLDNGLYVVEIENKNHSNKKIFKLIKSKQ